MTTARLTTVQNILQIPGTDRPIVGKQVSIRLNTIGFIDGGSVEKVRTLYAKTDATGMWSVELEVNADIDPAGSYYTVHETPGSQWSFIVPAAADPVNLRDILVIDPANPNPLVAGVPLPGNTVPSGYVWTTDGAGGGDYAAESAGGAVTAFNTRTGAVSLLKADVTGTGLTAADVGADTAAARDTAIGVETTRATAAETVNASAITAETTRATAGEAAAQAAAIAASQPVDSDLTAIAALSTTTYGRALLTLADAAALRTTAGLGTAATSNTTAFDAAGAAAAAQAASQPLDSDLTAIAALTTTSFGRSFLALADAAAGRTLLGLGTLATQSGTFSGTSSGTNTGDQSIPTALPPNGAASGDLSGTYPSPNVAKLNGTALSGLATGLLKNTTTTGVPSIAAAADVPTVAAGGAGALSATDATTTNSRAPSGSAGGDLSGTYPNPGVAKVNGTALSGLATGLLKNTTGTGVPSIATGADVPNITEAQVTNLTTDLAAKVPTSRLVSAGTGLSGGGDLSADRTLSMPNTGTAGTYGDSTHTLTVTTDAQGRITAVTANALGSSPGGLGVYGDGSDGTVTFDGSTAVSGTSRSGSTYTLTRDLYLGATTVNNGVIVFTAGWRMFVQGALVNNGTIHNGGTAASAQSAGGAAGANTYGNATSAGTGGGTGVGSNNGGGQSQSLGGSGGAGGAGTSGAGGTGATMSAPGSTVQGIRGLPGAITALPQNASGSVMFRSGGGGGSGAGDGTNLGGGGGGGGGACLVAAKTITGTGTIHARGGTGGNATGGNSGGGGGGGGGYVVVVTSSVSGGAITGQTIDAAGGSGGAKAGTGVAGSAGSAGLAVLLPN